MGRNVLVIFLISVILIEQIFASIQECTEDTDCIGEAVCANNLCQCPQGFTFSTNGYSCLKHSIGYGSACVDDTQCQWLGGRYICKDGGCSCGDGYRYFHGRCLEVKGLGAVCTRDEQCHVSNYISAMSCSEEGVCVCNEGFYPREGYDCRPEAHAVDDPCSLDTDCKMEGGFCDRELCAIENNGARNGAETNQIISRGATTYEVGIPCVTSEDCQDVANSVCSPLTNECICERGYFFSEGACVGEIGVNISCTADSHCSATSRRCADGACVCTNSQYYNNDLTKCIRVAYQPIFRCTETLACDILGKDAVCVPDGLFNNCKCRLGYQLNQETLLCEVNEDGGTNENACVEASDCSNVNAVCTNNICSCPADFRLVENTCLPNIGGECDSDTKICDVENGGCDDDNICSCDPDYTPTSITTCTKVVNELHEPCDDDLQCNAVIDYSHCSNGECECLEAYAEIDGGCAQKRDFGEYCVNVRQCRAGLGENVQCRNSICQCPANMIIDRLDCKLKSSAVPLLASFSLFICFLVTTHYFI